MVVREIVVRMRGGNDSEQYKMAAFGISTVENSGCITRELCSWKKVVVPRNTYDKYTENENIYSNNCMIK
jgi:hypothetical protein